MFDINKPIQNEEAKKDPIFVLAMDLKNKKLGECYSRQFLRNLLDHKRCGVKETRELMSRLKQNHIVVVGNLTRKQTDEVHLVFRYDLSKVKFTDILRYV